MADFSSAKALWTSRPILFSSAVASGSSMESRSEKNPMGVCSLLRWLRGRGCSTAVPSRQVFDAHRARRIGRQPLALCLAQAVRTSRPHRNLRGRPTLSASPLGVASRLHEYDAVICVRGQTILRGFRPALRWAAGLHALALFFSAVDGESPFAGLRQLEQLHIAMSVCLNFGLREMTAGHLEI